jgi:hypothetical protein
VPWRSSPRQRDHDGGWSETHRSGSVWCAPAALDLGVSHILLSELTLELVDDPERPRAYNAVLQSEYARLAGMSPAALTAAMEPYLPIVRVFALLAGWCGPAQREWLIQRAEATLRSED